MGGDGGEDEEDEDEEQKKQRAPIFFPRRSFEPHQRLGSFPLRKQERRGKSTLKPRRRTAGAAVWAKRAHFYFSGGAHRSARPPHFAARLPLLARLTGAARDARPDLLRLQRAHVPGARCDLRPQ